MTLTQTFKVIHHLNSWRNLEGYGLFLLSFFIYLLVLSFPLIAQDYPIHLQTDFYRIIERNLVIQGKQKNFHTGFKPYRALEVARWIENLDTVTLTEPDFKYLNRELFTYLSKSRNFVEPSKRKYFFKEDNAFLKWKNKEESAEKYHFSVNPVLNLNFGISPSIQDNIKSKDTVYLNSRGIEFFGGIGNRIGFYSYFADNQTVVPIYADEKIKKEGAVPGEGQWVLFKNKGYDFYSARGYVTMDIFNPYINLQFGHGRHFLGNGIRSVILSDFATDYPYLKLTTRIGKIQYTNLFSQMTDFIINKSDFEGVYPQKYFALHHLSINVTNQLNVGLFESVINGLPDSLNGGFQITYLNPIIFYRSVERNLGSPHNGNLGMDLTWDLFKSIQLYGQFLLDDYNFGERKNGEGWWGNKYALQGGLKFFNVAGFENFDLQYELNSVQPYTYTHWYKGQNYTHFGQSLAHPAGSNYVENLIQVNYSFRSRINLNLKYSYLQQGLDSLGIEWGSNIFGSGNPQQSYGNKILQGIPSTTKLFYSVITWRWNYNIFMDFTYFNRQQKIENSEILTHGWLLGFRMNIGRKEYLF